MWFFGKGGIKKSKKGEKMRPHEKLDVWKMSVDLVVKIYDCTKHFPPDEKFGLTSQIRRAAVSVPTNIAEGAARRFDKEFLQFLSVAQGSASELETELLIASKLGFIEKRTFSELHNELNLIARKLVGLSNYVKKRIR
ncbi:MAG: four helix bundle protein [Pyrinomonadaceae bacterium]